MYFNKNETDPRVRPSTQFIESIRQQFEVETEIDNVLTRKMNRRAEDCEPYTPITLDELAAAATDLIADKLGNEFEIANPRWLAGGASMLQMAFDLITNTPIDGLEPGKNSLVLRMSPKEPVVETSFKRESEVIKLVKQENLMPVPVCYWIDETGEFLPYPGIVYGFVKGVAKPSAVPSDQVTGIGLNFGPELRKRLAPQAVAHIANLHSFNAGQRSIPGFDSVTVGSNESVIREINWWQRVWDEDRGEEEPIIQLAASWLKENAPSIDHVSIIHNDLRSGNFLFDEETETISAWLDWELVSLGDRHQDLGWLLAYQFGHFSEDGQTFLASGLLPVEEFLTQYEAASGLPICRKKLQYYDILNTWKAAIIVMGTGYRVAQGGKTHQDVVVSWLSGIGYLVLGNLHRALSEVGE